jgi:hypothetical protein
MIMAVMLVAENTAVSEEGSTNSIDGEQQVSEPMLGSIHATSKIEVGSAPSVTKSPRGVHADDLADAARVKTGTTANLSRGENMKDDASLDASTPDFPEVTPELVAAIIAAMKGKSAGKAAVEEEALLNDDAPTPLNDEKGVHGEEDLPPGCTGGVCDNDDEIYGDGIDNLMYIVYDDDVDKTGLLPSDSICDIVCASEAYIYSGVRTKYALSKCLCKGRTLLEDFGELFERINKLNDEIMAKQSNSSKRASGVLVREPAGSYELLEVLFTDDPEVGLFCIEALLVIFIYYHPEWYMPFVGTLASICFVFATVQTTKGYRVILSFHFLALSIYTMALRGAKSVNDVVAGLFVLVNCVLAITITGLVLYKDSLNILTIAVIINTVTLGFTSLSMVTSKSINVGSIVFMALVIARAMPIMSNQMVGSISAIATIPGDKNCLQFFLTQLCISLYGGRRLHWQTHLDIANELNDLRLAVPQSLWIWWASGAKTHKVFDAKVMNLFSLLEILVWFLRFTGVFAYRLISTKGKWVGMSGRTDIPLKRRVGAARWLYEARGIFLTIMCPEVPTSMGDMYGLVFAALYLSFMSALVDLLVVAFLMVAVFSLIMLVSCRWLFDYDMILVAKEKEKKKKKKTFVMTPVVNQVDDGQIVVEEADTSLDPMIVIPQIEEHDLVETIETGFKEHASGGNVTASRDFSRLNSSDVTIKTKLGKCHAFKEGVYTLLTVAHAFIKTNIDDGVTIADLDDFAIEEYKIDIEGHSATPCMVEICHPNSSGTDALIRLTFADVAFKPVRGGFLPIHPVDGARKHVNWIMSRDGGYGQNMAERVSLTGYDCPILAYKFLTLKSDSGRPVGGLAVPYGMDAVGLHLGYCPCLARNVSIPLAGGNWRVLCGKPTVPTESLERNTLEGLIGAIEALVPDNPLRIAQTDSLVEFLEAEITKRVDAKCALKVPKPKVGKKPGSKAVLESAVAIATASSALAKKKAPPVKGAVVISQMRQFDTPKPDAETLAALKIARSYHRKMKNIRRRLRKSVSVSSSCTE